jgi:hypothetical protein
MILFAFALLAVGLLSATVGARLAKNLMPLFGLFAGTVIGYTGVQAVFGTGILSSTMAVFVAFAVGILIALLSYVFFDMAVTLLMGLTFASVFSYLGIALGLRENGFVVFMLSVAGLIIGIRYALNNPTTEAFLIYLTSFMGVAMILASVLLISGDLTTSELYGNGIVVSTLSVASQSFLWFLAWLGGSMIAAQVQVSSIAAELGITRNKK